MKLRPAHALLTVLLGSAVGLAQAQAPSGTFPLPGVDGKPLATTTGQRSFRCPLGFARVERFYREQLGQRADVTLRVKGQAGERTLVVTSKAKSDAWAKAVVKEGQAETTIEVTPVVRLSDQVVEGNGRPLVHFILSRSPEAAKAAEQLDHAQRD